MYALSATRSALKRAALAHPASRSATVAARYVSRTSKANSPEVERIHEARKRPPKTWTPFEDIAPGWNPELASPSEAMVKADRAALSVEELQTHTITYIHKCENEKGEPSPQEESEVKKRREEVSGEERIEAREATYEREEVDGPLRRSGKRSDQFQRTGPGSEMVEEEQMPGAA